MSYVNRDKTRRIETIAAHAQWFEDHTPWAPAYRKPEVTGVSARAIDVVIETGDSGPITPVGINLPNDQAVRERYGSKSVSLANVNEAYERSMPEGLRTEFCVGPGRGRAHARVGRAVARSGHRAARGHRARVGPHGRRACRSRRPSCCGNRYSALEEARSDLVALYFLPGRQAGGAGSAAGRRARRHRAHRVRAVHARRADAAAPRARGQPARRRSHAQPPADRELAAPAHDRHRSPPARGQDLLHDGGRRRVSRRRRRRCSPKCSESRARATTRRPAS